MAGIVSLIPALSFLIGGLLRAEPAVAFGIAIACAIPVIGHIWIVTGLVMLFGNQSSDIARIASTSALITPVVGAAYFGILKFFERLKALSANADFARATKPYSEKIEQIRALLSSVPG